MDPCCGICLTKRFTGGTRSTRSTRSILSRNRKTFFQVAHPIRSQVPARALRQRSQPLRDEEAIMPELNLLATTTGFQQQTFLIDTVGTSTFQVPAGVGTMTITAVGGGGGGGSSGTFGTGGGQNTPGGGGGGAGGNSMTVNVPATGISVLVLSIASGGVGGSAPPVTGTSTNFGGVGGTTTVTVGTNSLALLTATGGGGGQPGLLSGTSNGGNGGSGGSSSNPGGGGGGGSSPTLGGSGGIPGSVTGNLSFATAGTPGTATLGGSGGSGSGNRNATAVCTGAGSAGGQGGGAQGGTGGNNVATTGAAGSLGGGGGGGGTNLTTLGNGGNGGSGYVSVSLFLAATSSTTTFTAISPTVGTSGTSSIMILGTGLTFVHQVLFGTLPTHFVIQDEGHLLAYVPPGLTVGNVVITLLLTNSTILTSTASSLTFTVVAAGSLTPYCARQGQASTFGLLAQSTITNQGRLLVNGNVGVSNMPSGGGNVIGILFTFLISPATLHIGDSLTTQAEADAFTFYSSLQSAVPTSVVTTDLGGLTLLPGIYNLSSVQADASLTGILTLNFNGNPSNVYVFQISGNFTIAPSSSIVVSNGGSVGAGGCNVFWQIGGLCSIGNSVTGLGSLVSMSNITLGTNTVWNGRFMSIGGSLTSGGGTLVNIPQCICN